MQEQNGVKKMLHFFDKLEDKVRASLSRQPIIYSIVGGVAIVLFWRGVWLVADNFSFMTGPVSILVSLVILLATGLFASFFVGDQIIISGLRREKKLIEKTEEEQKLEMSTLSEVRKEIKHIEESLDRIEHDIHGK